MYVITHLIIYMYFKLEQPKINKIDPKKFQEIFINPETKKEVFDFVQRINSPVYLYWDKAQYKEPSPKNMSKEELWIFAKFIRDSDKEKSEIKSSNGEYFSWVKLPNLEEFFHKTDQDLGGNLLSFKVDIDKNNKQKLISRGVVEEAIASSQLEGADTTREVAKRFLRESRKPKNESERMILNNYIAIKKIEDEYKNKELNLKLLLEMHGDIVKDVVDELGEKPRLRKNGDKIFVTNRIDGTVYHEGPNVEFVQKELIRLFDFANDKSNTLFLHPIIKAIMLHFWLAYLHPFTDGNGRVSRLLFYWYLLKHDYWAFAYLPISRIIKKAPDKYKMAFVYTEQDDLDLTYFIDYSIEKIQLAIDDFIKYVKKRSLANSNVNKIAKIKYNLNERQIQLLQFFIGDKNEKTTIQIHTNLYQITRKTAANDLKGIEKKGFVFSKKQGRTIYYYPTKKIQEIF